MRKHIAVIIALVMAFSLCGCGSSKSLFPENTGNKQQTKTADSGSIKVGYLLSSDGDAPDTVARVQGIRKMQEETGIADDQIIIAESVKKADCEKKAAELGYTIKVETRGSSGAKNVVTDEEIANAVGIIVAADTKVPMERFNGKIS